MYKFLSKKLKKKKKKWESAEKNLYYASLIEDYNNLSVNAAKMILLSKCNRKNLNFRIKNLTNK